MKTLLLQPKKSPIKKASKTSSVMEFPVEKFKIIKDSFVKHRDGNSKLLYISCAKCNEPIMVYQKDGKGGLLRCYADRIVWPANFKQANLLICPKCNNVIANPMVYSPEKRFAFRLIPGTVHTDRGLKRARNRLPS